MHLPDSPSEQLDLVAVLRSAGPFAALHEDALRELAAEMTYVAASDGDVVVRQGEIVENLYVVASGVLRVTSVDGRGIAQVRPQLEAGGLCGEMHVLSRSAAPATIEARGPTLLAQLSRRAFDRFLARCPSEAIEVIDRLGPRLRKHRLSVTLQVSDLFRDLDSPVLTALESELELVSLYGGEVLFRQGDQVDSVYVVVSGRLRVVTVDTDGGETLLAELGSGETVGEMAIITGEPRSATVYAIRDTQLARLSKASTERLLQHHPRSMLLVLTSRIVSRLRKMSSGERRTVPIATIAVVPASTGVALTDFSEQLTTALSRLGRTLHLTSHLIDRSFEREGAAQAHDREGGSTGLVEWLAQREMDHRYLVYQSNPLLSPWTERCLRQADRVVVVADASADPTPGEIEAELLSGNRAIRMRPTLVLLHRPDSTSPSGTTRWLSGRTVERHLHVRLGHSEDFDRLARFLAGNAVGLVLGGGFARGLAHLGVLRALQELNIPVDAIGGSSMGAMIGAQWTIGWDASKIVHETRTALADSFDDMTIPFLAFKSGGKHSRLIRRFFGDIRIEDMWTPFFCVSANLNRAELKVHTTGSLANAVLASTRAPGVFPPVVMDGELHVDGGLINNVPVDVMKTFSNGGMVIGVDVSPPHELNHVADYGDELFGWHAIWHRFNPARERRIYRPSILLVLMRTIEFGGIAYRKQKAEVADVYISPELLKFKRNDFHAAAAIADIGYGAAREKLIDWLARGPEDLRGRRPDLFASIDRQIKT